MLGLGTMGLRLGFIKIAIQHGYVVRCVVGVNWV